MVVPETVVEVVAVDDDRDGDVDGVDRCNGSEGGQGSRWRLVCASSTYDNSLFRTRVLPLAWGLPSNMVRRELDLFL